MRVFVLAVAAVVVSTGCRPTGSFVREPASLDGTSAPEIVMRNHANAPHVKSIRAQATLNVETKKSAGQFSMLLAVKTPDSIFIKIEGPLGIDGLKASINSRTFTVYNIIQHTVIKGSTNSGAIRRTLEYEISFSELMETLTGCALVPSVEPDGIETDGSYFVLRFVTGENEKKYWIDPYFGFSVSRIVESRGGVVIMEREFSRFEKVDGFFYPRYVRVFRPQHNDLLSLFFESRVINKPIKGALFNVSYPDDVKVVQTDE